MAHDRVVRILRFAALAIAAGACGTADAQAAATLPLIRARPLAAGAPVKVFFPSGRIRIETWNRDSIEVRGRIPRVEQFYLGGDRNGVKLGVEDHPDGSDVRPGDIVLRVPRGSQLSVKTVSAAITGRDVSGWFYSVSGVIRLSGTATSVEAESMAGDVYLDVSVPWERARTGGGRLVVTGAPADLDAATVRGALDVQSAAVMRGRFASVEGDIRYAGVPSTDGVFEFSNHSGAVELVLPRAVSTTLELSTITGTIENGFTPVRAAAGAGGHGGTLRMQLGAGGSRMTVRTFRGTIRLQPR